jgi:outer membrane protein OmpA-like peptidoglycan-associated protein
MFGAAKFAEVEPIYQFYWDRLMDLGEELVQNPEMRVRFEGHACAIGSDAVNQRLSLGRAEAFTNAFKERLRRAYPGLYEDIWSRIDQPVGYGENVPLDIRVRGQGDLLLGDNETPVGRYLNRRIMVLLYKEN